VLADMTYNLFGGMLNLTHHICIEKCVQWDSCHGKLWFGIYSGNQFDRMV